MKKKLNRQIEDYILTDLLPAEKGNFYTHTYFYEYLVENNIDKLCKRNTLTSHKLGNQRFHASPLKYKIRKKGGFREISLLNPLSVVESFFFIQCFGTTILNIIDSKNFYGQRVARKNKKLLYKKVNGQTVYYKDGHEREQFLFLLESSGTFYNHKPFKKLHRFLDGRYNSYLLDRYRNVVHFDIENFFGSIYTHTFTWLMVNNNLDAIAIKDQNSIYNNIDTFLQNVNGSKTNGIVVGPEISRLLADFLLVNIEERIHLELVKEGYVKGADYDLCRFVDDYYLYTNDLEKSHRIFEIITDNLNYYHLKINYSKTETLSTDEYHNQWIESTREIIDFQIEKIFVDSSETSGNKKVKYINVKNAIQLTIIKTGLTEKICSYLMSAILNKLEVMTTSEINMSYIDFTNLCFYLLSLNSSYVANQKIIRIFSLLLAHDEMKLDYIERGVTRFEEEIFAGYINDWINILLFFGANNIRISNKSEKKIIDEYLSAESKIDPRILAGLLMYLNLTKTKLERKEYFFKINEIVESNLKLINKGKFFLDEKSWWVFLFNNCPFEELNKAVLGTQLIIDDIMGISDVVNVDMSKNKLDDKAKLCVINFLKSGGGFINWDLSKESEHEKVYFYTRNRTIFGTDLEDFLDISN